MPSVTLGLNKVEIAQFSEGEMILVESMDSVEQLSQILIDNRETLPRYHINAKGATSVEADFPNPYTIDLVPAGWLNGDTTITDGTSMYIQDSEITWSMEVWNRPETTQFFGIQFSSESPLYQQWHSAVDVGAFVPLVFEGTPTQYQSGVPFWVMISSLMLLGWVPFARILQHWLFCSLMNLKDHQKFIGITCVAFILAGMLTMAHMVIQRPGVQCLKPRNPQVNTHTPT